MYVIVLIFTTCKSDRYQVLFLIIQILHVMVIYGDRSLPTSQSLNKYSIRAKPERLEVQFLIWHKFIRTCNVEAWWSQTLIKDRIFRVFKCLSSILKSQRFAEISIVLTFLVRLI